MWLYLLVVKSAPVLIFFVLTLPPLGHLLIVIDRCLLISTAVLAKASLCLYRVFVAVFCFAYITVDQSYAYTYQSLFQIFLVFARSTRLRCAHLNINHAVNKWTYTGSVWFNSGHILGLSESRLSSRISDSVISMPGYNIVRVDPKTQENRLRDLYPSLFYF